MIHIHVLTGKAPIKWVEHGNHVLDVTLNMIVMSFESRH